MILFDKPLGSAKKQARTYTGYCADSRFTQRMAEHRAGRGSAMTRAAAQRGIGFKLHVKAQKNALRVAAQWGRVEF